MTLTTGKPGDEKVYATLETCFRKSVKVSMLGIIGILNWNNEIRKKECKV